MFNAKAHRIKSKRVLPTGGCSPVARTRLWQRSLGERNAPLEAHYSILLSLPALLCSPLEVSHALLCLDGMRQAYLHFSIPVLA